jgi:hypothetical protein
MIHKKLKITILDKGVDQEGRIPFPKYIHNGKKMLQEKHLNGS